MTQVLLWALKVVGAVLAPIALWVLTTAKDAAVTTMETVDTLDTRLTAIEAVVKDAASALQVEQLAAQVSGMDKRLEAQTAASAAIQAQVAGHENRLTILEIDSARRAEASQQWQATYGTYLLERQEARSRAKKP
jgi:predicted RND superfamily exporter protein